MPQAGLIQAAIVAGDNITAAEHWGDYEFVCLPRVGEQIAVGMRLNIIPLEVISVNHAANPVIDSDFDKRSLAGPSVWLHCKKI